MSLINEPCIEIRAVYGGYVVSCVEPMRDEEGNLLSTVASYSCAMVEDVCNLVRFALENVDSVDTDDVDTALRDKAKRQR